MDEYYKPYIGDFGLARGGADWDENTHRTISAVMGTEHYLPPDFRRNKELHVAVDTYCYGIFLFELVTGKKPSWIDPTSSRRSQTMRDIMLREDSIPITYVDENLDYSDW